MNLVSKVQKVMTALVENKEELTAKQIAARFSLANPYDAVYRIRRAGYVINRNTRTDSSNRTKTKYGHRATGADVRSLVALGYKAQSYGLAL